MDRRAKLLWMRDILDHLGHCFEQYQAADPHAEHYLTASIERDLNEFRRLCQSLQMGPGAESRLAAL